MLLPDAPLGFEWKNFSDVMLLKPHGWHDREKAVTETIPTHELYAASPEHFSEAVPFETGFTVQIIRNAEQLAPDAAALAKLYLAPIFDGRPSEQILMLDVRTVGDIERTVVRFLDAPSGLQPIIVHKFVAAKTTTGTVYIFTFECPQATWDENWTRYGTPILGNLAFLNNMPANEAKY